MTDGIPSCVAHDGYIDGCLACLRAWLDRPPPRRLDRRDDYEFVLDRKEFARGHGC